MTNAFLSHLLKTPKLNRFWSQHTSSWRSNLWASRKLPPLNIYFKETETNTCTCVQSPTKSACARGTWGRIGEALFLKIKPDLGPLPIWAQVPKFAEVSPVWICAWLHAKFMRAFLIRQRNRQKADSPGFSKLIHIHTNNIIYQTYRVNLRKPWISNRIISCLSIYTIYIYIYPVL